MFKSRKSYLLVSIIVLILTIYLIVDVIINWNSLMQTDRMRLFIRILLSALFIYKSIDYFLEWRNHGKPHAQEE